MRLVRFVSVLMLVLSLLAGRRAGAQELSVAWRGPRFIAAWAGIDNRVDASNAAVLRRTVTLDLTDASLGDALEAVRRAADLDMSYTAAALPGKTVSLHVRDLTVAAALTQILLDAGLDVAVTRTGRLALVPKAPPAPAILANEAIVGRVTDAKSRAPLAGAIVAVEGTSRSATTGNDGRYRIVDVAPGTYTLRARYIGYAPGTASVTVSPDQATTADFTLEKSAQRLNEVVTTGTVIPTEVKALPSPISVITSDEIQARHIQRIDQLLRGDIPGVFAWDRGTDNATSLVYSRGATSPEGGSFLKTYVDGVEISNPAYLGELDPNSIERIEIIRGPQASTIYGSEALNGVLQVFTKTGSLATRPHLDARISAGVFQTKWMPNGATDQQDYSGSLSGGGEQFSYTLGGGHVHTGEWVPEYFNTDNSLYGSIRSTSGPFTLAVSSRYYHLSHGTPLAPVLEPYATQFHLLPENTDRDVETEAIGLTLGYRLTARWTHSITLGYDRVDDAFNGRPRLTTPADTLSFRLDNQGSKPSVRYYTALNVPLGSAAAGVITAGADYYQARTDASYIRAPITTGTFPGTAFLFGARTDFHNAGYFAQTELSVADQFFVTLGLRAEDNANLGQDYGLAWAPRAGLAYVAALGSVTLKARASYGKSIRPPGQGARDGSTSPDAVQLPNPLLAPEVQRGWDAGAELYYRNILELKATYYRQEADGLIENVVVDATAVPQVTQNQNVGLINNRGWELELSASQLGGFSVTGTYSQTASEVATLSPSYTGDLRVGDQVIGIPRHTAGATIGYHLGRASASLGMAHFGAWTQTDWAAFYASIYGGQPRRPSGRDYWITYPAFEKYRLNLAYDFTKQVTAFLAIENLANNYASEFYNLTPSAGRVTMAGFHLAL